MIEASIDFELATGSPQTPVKLLLVKLQLAGHGAAVLEPAIGITSQNWKPPLRKGYGREAGESYLDARNGQSITRPNVRSRPQCGISQTKPLLAPPREEFPVPVADRTVSLGKQQMRRGAEIGYYLSPGLGLPGVLHPGRIRMT